MKISEIKQEKPFKGLFPITPENIKKIKKDIAANGYDPAFPVTIWKETGILLDGHIRLQALQELEITEVEIIEKSFLTKEHALEYAIHCQRDRRNLTDAEIFSAVVAIDRTNGKGKYTRKPKAEPKTNTVVEKTEPVVKQKKEKPTHIKTAKTLGIGQTKVSKIRKIIKKPELAEEVKEGKKTIEEAYQEVKEPNKSKKIPVPSRVIFAKEIPDELQENTAYMITDIYPTNEQAQLLRAHANGSNVRVYFIGDAEKFLLAPMYKRETVVRII